MSLSTEERAEMERKLQGYVCPRCGGQLVAYDDGYTSKRHSGWGISGAYVVCDNCWKPFDPPAVDPEPPQA